MGPVTLVAAVPLLPNGSAVAIWSILFLDERHGPLVWLALAVLFLGLFLVQPRPRLPVFPPPG